MRAFDIDMAYSRGSRATAAVAVLPPAGSKAKAMMEMSWSCRRARAVLLPTRGCW